jgi:ubiquitin thioesterase protein OTUB1
MQELFLEKVGDNSIKTIDDVISIFCDPSISNYLVLMMRFITSGELKNNSVIYETFIEN